MTEDGSGQQKDAAAARLEWLDSLSKEEQLRYYLFTRSRIGTDAVLHMASPLLPPPYLIDEASIGWALSAAAKSFVVQLAEEG